MPRFYNETLKTIQWYPASYFGTEGLTLIGGEKLLKAEEMPIVERPEPAVEGYVAGAKDGDADGLVQDGTPFQRPEGTELSLSEQKEAVKKSKKTD